MPLIKRQEAGAAGSTAREMRRTAALLDALARLIDRQDLSADQMRGVMADMIGGGSGEAEVAAVLTAMRMKGETAAELAAAAAVLREHMVRLETGRSDLLDTCGTGGDETGTFNISTATAFVVAACGVPVPKHGNRGVSSSSGSADCLEQLGVNINLSGELVTRCIDELKIGFCFAPVFHPSYRHASAVRREIGVPTVFNLLGPLTNPAWPRAG